MKKSDAMTNEISGIYKLYMIEMPESEVVQPYFYKDTGKETLLKRLLDNYAEERTTFINDLDEMFAYDKITRDNQDTVDLIKNEFPEDLERYSELFKYYVDTENVEFFDRYFLYYTLMTNQYPEYESKAPEVSQLFKNLEQMIQKSASNPTLYAMPTSVLKKKIKEIYLEDYDYQSARKTCEAILDSIGIVDMVQRNELLKRPVLKSIFESINDNKQFKTKADSAKWKNKINEISAIIMRLKNEGILKFDIPFQTECINLSNTGYTRAIWTRQKSLLFIAVLDIYVTTGLEEIDLKISPKGVEQRFFFEKNDEIVKVTDYSSSTSTALVSATNLKAKELKKAKLKDVVEKAIKNNPKYAEISKIIRQ